MFGWNWVHLRVTAVIRRDSDSIKFIMLFWDRRVMNRELKAGFNLHYEEETFLSAQ